MISSRILEIDLAEQHVYKLELNENEWRKCLGGSGGGTSIYLV